MRLCILLFSLLAIPSILLATTKSRVKAVVNTRYNTGSSSYKPTDSTTYKYLGLHNGSMVPASTTGWLFTGKYDTSLKYSWNSSANYYYKDTLASESFDIYGNIIKQTYQFYDSIAVTWKNTVLNSYTYNASGNQLTFQQQWWSTSSAAWGDYELVVNTYNASSDLTSDTTFYWGGSPSIKYPYYLDEYTYDSHHNLTMKTTYTYSGGWQFSQRFNYYYNTSDLVDSMVLQTYYSSAWHNVDRHGYSYNSSSILLTDTSQQWSTNHWQNNQLIVNVYSGTIKEAVLIMPWSGISGTWQNNEKDTMLYDASNNMLAKIATYWYGATSSYINARMDTNGYNIYNQAIYYCGISWGISNTWTPSGNDPKYHYYYETYIDPTRVANTQAVSEIKLCPCPATDVMTLELKWQQPQEATLAIYDMGGRQWRQWHLDKTATYHETIPVNMLPSGNYILSVESNGERIARQFTIAR